jgi:hypothetical protein
LYVKVGRYLLSNAYSNLIAFVVTTDCEAFLLVTMLHYVQSAILFAFSQKCRNTFFLDYGKYYESFLHICVCQ